ncbi:YebG family protein [Raoultella planticola]|uniref:YebG family protein n=1 Tax=Raoultella planticola TaxID=575 RepID=A0ABU5M2K7_RAOPL|nr:YebG family protein [Raoultella planticola]MDW4554855.1 YebG family protein [Raoultella planticola]MDZ7445599.1 YebG family protein [Raoultella planticola]MDZ7466438.1 YebG family protein [Raoultella planticola]MDZ7507590.1 YebG family protein [Raoultella planticola]MEA5396094.1 YebG family protein [Raoultella planticola]
MAVEIKYVVIREGEEKMSFTSKKEADAYDKMLDLAEVLNDWLVECPLTLDETQRDEMAMWLAERKETLHHILRSGKLPEAEAEAEAEAEDGTNGQASQDESSAAETSEAAAEGASEQPAATAPVKSRKVKAA